MECARSWHNLLEWHGLNDKLDFSILPFSPNKFSISCGPNTTSLATEIALIIAEAIVDLICTARLQKKKSTHHYFL
jgi:hypothetical protein